MAIFTGIIWIVASLLIPETYAPYILRKRAQRLSKVTGKTYISALDADKPPSSAAHQLGTALTRPWVLLLKEPIVLITSIYISIIYGTMYMCFAAFPIVFQNGRGWSQGIGGLAFAGTVVGVILAILSFVFEDKRYTRAAVRKGAPLEPEDRLPPAMVGSIFIPIGLFWFAWTIFPSIHWSVPIIGTVFFAWGLVLVFMALLNYLIDSCKLSLLAGHFPLLTQTRCNLRCISDGSQLSPPIPVRCRLSTLHATNVSQSRQSLGKLHPSFPRASLCTFSISLL